MSTEQDVFKQINPQTKSGYRINEIIKIAIPYRQLVVSALIDKAPEKAIQKIYEVLLRCISIGLDTEKELKRFLGLGEEDFILRELLTLREKLMLGYVGGKYLLTDAGKEFIKGNNTIRVTEKNEIKVFINGVTNSIETSDEKISSSLPHDKWYPSSFANVPHKSSQLLLDKFEELSRVYKQSNKEGSLLIDADFDNIIFDSTVAKDCYLIEYIPLPEHEEKVPFIDIRDDNEGFPKNKALARILNERYPENVHQLSEFDRELTDDLSIIEPEEANTIKGVSSLTVWETQQAYHEAIENTKKRILIESPWMRKAAAKNLDAIKKLLKNKVKVYILYGIDLRNEHDEKTLNDYKELEQQFGAYLKLINLPVHFKNRRISFTGTHRKLVIKDNDYFIAGSYNFLSFNKELGDKIANEESFKIYDDVSVKWDTVIKEYQLEGIIE